MEVSAVELVDATDPEEHNSNSEDSIALSGRSCMIDDTKFQANVSILFSVIDRM